ncbi:MAG: DUF6362 family protein [Geminicoccaceae bacterium]
MARLWYMGGMDALALSERLREAVVTLHNLRVSPGPKEPQAAWPTVVHDFWAAYSTDMPFMRRPVPSSEAISKMDEVLGWLAQLRRQTVPSDAERDLWTRLLWARGAMFSWEVIADQLRAHGHKISGKTVQRRYDVAMACLIRIAQKGGQRQAAA